MRIASRAGNGAQKACAEKKQTKFLGENFRETLKHILKTAEKPAAKTKIVKINHRIGAINLKVQKTSKICAENA